MVTIGQRVGETLVKAGLFAHRCLETMSQNNRHLRLKGEELEIGISNTMILGIFVLQTSIAVLDRGHIITDQASRADTTYSKGQLHIGERIVDIGLSIVDIRGGTSHQTSEVTAIYIGFNSLDVGHTH